MPENFTLIFFSFISLNLLLVINAAFITIFLSKFEIKSWGKFILSLFVLFTLQVFLSQILLGVFGKLNYSNIWVFTVILFIINLLLLGKKIWTRTKFPPPPKIKLLPFLLIFSPFIALFVIRYFYALFQVPLEYDNIAYHLPFVVEWYKTQSLLPVYYNAFAGPLGYYPSNFELFELWTFLPFGTDLFINFINFPLFGLLILSAFLILKNFKVSSTAAWLSIGFLISMPLFLHFLGFPHVDLFFTVCFNIALYFLQEFWKTASLSDLGLAGIAIGLFIGTKYLGIPYAFPLILLAFITLLKHFLQNKKQLLFALTILSSSSLVGGGFWYIRNWLNSGNPVFPTDVSLGSFKIFEGYYGLTERIFKLTLAYNIHDFSAFQEFILGFLQQVGLQTFIIPLCIVLSILLSGFLIIKMATKLIQRKNTAQETKTLWIIFLFTLGTLFYFYFYWKAPYTYDNLIPNVRYSVPLLVTSSLLIGLLISKIKILKPVFAFLLPLITFYNLTNFVIHDNQEKIITGDKIPLDYSFIAQHLNYFLIFLLCIGLGIVFLCFTMQTLAFRKVKNIFITVAFFLGFILCTNNLFKVSTEKREMWKNSFFEQYYTIEPLQNLPITEATAWFDQNAPHANIAYTGFNFHYYLFGRNLERDAQYININECVDCRYGDYKNSKDSIRRDPDFQNWFNNLKTKKREYLIIAPTVVPGVKNWEDEWVKKHPKNFKLVFQKEKIFVYKIIY